MSGPFISYRGEVVNLGAIASAWIQQDGMIQLSVVGTQQRVIRISWPPEVFKKLYKKAGVVDFEDLEA